MNYICVFKMSGINEWIRQMYLQHVTYIQTIPIVTTPKGEREMHQ